MPVTISLPNSCNLFFWKKRSVTITEYDPSYKVLYLGNILTPWAKGKGCEEKPLQTLWKVYNANSTKLNIPMDMTICNSGIKANTKKHGLTEYWAYRITYCCAPKEYPGVFCWVYRHEGQRLKQEFRFHAVLCTKPEQAKELVTQLNNRLAFALQEFRREKLTRQKARLSLANSCYECPSMPRRKLLLYRGSINFRPPIEMSKIAPKLTDIEEALEEEEEAKFFNLLNTIQTWDELYYYNYSSSLDSETSSSSSCDYYPPKMYKNSVSSLNSLSTSSSSSCDYYPSRMYKNSVSSLNSLSTSSSSDEQLDDGIIDLSEHALLLS